MAPSRFSEGPTHIPEMTWEDYYAMLRAKREEGDGTNDAEDKYDIVITQEARPLAEPISALGRYVTLGRENGWEVYSLAHSKSLQHQPPVATGDNAGRPRPDRNVEMQWCYMVKDGEVIEVSYMIVNGKTSSADTVRRLNRRPMSDASLKSIIKGEA